MPDIIGYNCIFAEFSGKNISPNCQVIEYIMYLHCPGHRDASKLIICRPKVCYHFRFVYYTKVGTIYCQQLKTFPSFHVVTIKSVKTFYKKIIPDFKKHWFQFDPL